MTVTVIDMGEVRESQFVECDRDGEGVEGRVRETM